MITIGLDFGTHQTKVCIENKQGVELNYSFLKFNDNKGGLNSTLPSIIHIDENGYLSYGYIPHGKRGKIVRYFKQATFTPINNGQSETDAIYYSIWYLAFILFELEERYGQEFVIQMGVPTDAARLAKQKHLAIQVLSSAYKLVEDFFEGDKEAFLTTTIEDLKEVTEFVDYSKDLQEEYQMLVFPEAYACLMPLISSSKIASGMSLMVDIGGGTTDISFFTIKNDKPQVYDFKSINRGLNYLTDADRALDNRADSNVRNSTEIKNLKRIVFKDEINTYCNNLKSRLRAEFQKQCNLRDDRLMDALKSRPIIYTGGGSTFGILRTDYAGFEDVMHISEKEWRTEAVVDMDEIKALGLCPILSTAYGLSISVPDDNIKCEEFGSIFKKLRGAVEDKTYDYDRGSARPTSYRSTEYYFAKDNGYTLNYNSPGQGSYGGSKKKHGKKRR